MMGIWVWILIAYAVIEAVIIVWPKDHNPVSRYFKELVTIRIFSIDNPLILGLVFVSAVFWAPDFLCHSDWYTRHVTRRMFDDMVGMAEQMRTFGFGRKRK